MADRSSHNPSNRSESMAFKKGNDCGETQWNNPISGIVGYAAGTSDNI